MVFGKQESTLPITLGRGGKNLQKLQYGYSFTCKYSYKTSGVMLNKRKIYNTFGYHKDLQIIMHWAIFLLGAKCPEIDVLRSPCSSCVGKQPIITRHFALYRSRPSRFDDLLSRVPMVSGTDIIQVIGFLNSKAKRKRYFSPRQGSR